MRTCAVQRPPLHRSTAAGSLIVPRLASGQALPRLVRTKVATSFPVQLAAFTPGPEMPPLPVNRVDPRCLLTLSFGLLNVAFCRTVKGIGALQPDEFPAASNTSTV